MNEEKSKAGATKGITKDLARKALILENVRTWVLMNSSVIKEAMNWMGPRLIHVFCGGFSMPEIFCSWGLPCWLFSCKIKTAFGLCGIVHGKKAFRRTLSGLKEAGLKSTTVPKGYFAVYVGEDEQKHYVVSVSYLDKPVLEELLSMAEEEFGYEHPMGGLTIPCREEIIIDLTSRF
ncbi:hypothetical protein TIFTF001_032412 [Ficus carica]|uniref:Small auxin up regulated protein n=1 Tax=Ficus carica TaxID=3494 RepID=A0AA88DXF4_FICCA|nr:hypothetical protein TIFTF001_032412 [Ficus carica]